MEKFLTIARFNKFEKHVDQRFEQLAAMIAKGFEEVDAKFQRMEMRMESMVKEVDVRPRVNDLERRVDRLEARKK